MPQPPRSTAFAHVQAPALHWPSPSHDADIPHSVPSTAAVPTHCPTSLHLPFATHWARHCAPTGQATVARHSQPSDVLPLQSAKVASHVMVQSVLQVPWMGLHTGLHTDAKGAAA